MVDLLPQAAHDFTEFFLMAIDRRYGMSPAEAYQVEDMLLKHQDRLIKGNPSAKGRITEAIASITDARARASSGGKGNE